MPDSTLPEPFVRLDLPARADPLGDPGLLASLRDCQGQALLIDASQLRQPNAPLVEMLLVAASAWRESGAPFQITGLSPAHEEQLRALGLAAPLGLDTLPPAEGQPA